MSTCIKHRATVLNTFASGNKYLGYRWAKHSEHIMRHTLISPTRIIKNLLQNTEEFCLQRSSSEKKKKKRNKIHHVLSHMLMRNYFIQCFCFPELFNGKESMSWLIFLSSFIFICRQMALILKCSVEMLWSISRLQCLIMRSFFNSFTPWALDTSNDVAKWDYLHNYSLSPR